VVVILFGNYRPYQNKGPLFITNINTEKTIISDKEYLDFFIKTFIEDQMMCVKYQFNVKKFEGVIFCVMPILNYTYGCSHIIYRLFAINNTQITKRFNLDYSLELKFEKSVSLKSWGISPFTMVYQDVIIDNEEMLQKISEEQLVFFMFSLPKVTTEGESLSSKKVSFSFALLGSPVYKVKKPRSFHELAASHFLETTSKSYVDVSIIARLLHDTHAYLSPFKIFLKIFLSLILIILAPLFITELILDFKRKLTHKNLESLQLTPMYLRQPTEEWLQTIAKQRQEAIQSIEEEIRDKKQELEFKAELANNYILTKELIISGVGMLSTVLYHSVMANNQEIKLHVAFFNFRNQKSTIRFKVGLESLGEKKQKSFKLTAPANDFVTSELTILTPEIPLPIGKDRLVLSLGQSGKALPPVMVSILECLLCSLQCLCIATWFFSSAPCIIYSKSSSVGGGQTLKQIDTIPIYVYRNFQCLACNQGLMNYDNLKARWVCSSCHHTIPKYDPSIVTSYFNNLANKYYVKKKGFFDGELAAGKMEVWVSTE